MQGDFIVRIDVILDGSGTETGLPIGPKEPATRMQGWHVPVTLEQSQRSLLPEFQPNNSMIGLPVVIGREMPVLFCGSLSGMSRAW